MSRTQHISTNFRISGEIFIYGTVPKI